MSMTSREAAALFDELNQKFWGGRKPRYRVVVTRQERLVFKGYCDIQKKTIRLSDRLSRAEARTTLLHEMCHIGCPYHGKEFCRRLRALAKAGEAWAEEEAVGYEDESNSFSQQTRRLKDQLADIAFSGPVAPSWRKVLRPLADDWGLRPFEMTRIFPWLPAAWKKAKKSSAEFYKRRAALTK